MTCDHLVQCQCMHLHLPLRAPRVGSWCNVQSPFRGLHMHNRGHLDDSNKTSDHVRSPRAPRPAVIGRCDSLKMRES